MVIIIKKMKQVITLLTCSTLPYNDNEEGDDDNGGELCHYDALYFVFGVCSLLRVG